MRLGRFPRPELGPGQVGYVLAGIKRVSDTKVGDTLLDADDRATELLPGYREVKPMVFSGLYPTATEQYEELRDALEKLKLNDASLFYEPETSTALGFGFRCGFLGLLHMDIVQERLEREFGLDLITTVPNVEYHVALSDGGMLQVENPTTMPDRSKIDEIREPYVRALIEYRANDLVKLDMLINGDPIDAFSVIIHRDKAYEYGRAMAEKLRQLIPRQLFEVAIQASIGGKVIARESIKALRKNVTAKCYGGDITRKRKLLEKQKEGKRRMKQVGTVEIPQEAFLAVLQVGE
jgi:GTP-binding protein LepA